MLPLSEYVPYLLNRAGARAAGAFGDALRVHGISLPMWRVLAALHQEEGQRVGQLAGLTTIEFSTLSRLLDGMVEKGLVERRRSGEDARTVVVRRTAAGRALTERLLPLALACEAALLEGLTRDEVRTLKRLLRRLYENAGRFEASLRQEAAAE